MQNTINRRKEYELKENIRLFGCLCCPYFVDNNDEKEHCDLANKEILPSKQYRIAPQWCPLRRKIR